MEVTVSVRRFNPEEAEQGSYWQDYGVDVEETASVLDSLIKIREEIDGSLALRCSCRSAICGSCAMRINGHAKLACNTKITELASPGQTVTVEPAGNMPVLKDLVVDQNIFWDKIRQVSPWIKPTGPEPGGEYLAPNADMVHLAGVMACIMCGACVSDCTVLEVDKNFIGPAALAKAYRFVADPRDGDDKTRLGMLSEYSGIWDCTRCYECVEVCPKDVAPMDRIMALRDKAMGQGYGDNYGARHTEVFAQSVSHSGWLNELMLPIKTFGMFNLPAMMNMAPVGLRALLKGKMPSLFHKPVPEVEKVRRLVKRVADEQKET
ncbi:succinate dehydrogenase iron-sulfur subunit [SAR202 cluster bacterium AD-804-J14_MRT_500m]|nr:succinate dehydrogenase iron-sulfur subunit [SAR202 cluster bacterium AD-804-J14_MRT_500m]